MSDESTDATLSEAEYAALEAALSAGARGRMFLAEVQARGRSRELAVVLAAVERLGRGDAPGADMLCILQAGLSDLSGAIGRAGAQISALDGEDVPGRPLGQRLHEQHRALTEVLDAAERIQEAAWTLREQGVDGPVCDFLDERATEIYAACGRQEAEARVAATALAAYDFIVERVGDLCRTCGIDLVAPGAVATPAAASDPPRAPVATLPASTALVSDDVAFVLPGDRDQALLVEPRSGGDAAAAFAEIDRLSTREKIALFS